MEQNSESSGRKGKTSKSRRETAVQGTNDNSIVSKCSMSAAGYFEDSFLQHFVAKTTRRAPLINRGYFVRAVCIDQVLKQFLTRYQDSKKQIVSLGAGFDSAYFRLKAEGCLKDTSFFEIDFPEVTKRKHAIIQDNSTLLSLLNIDGSEKKLVPPIELWTSDYCLLGVDLTQLNTLEAAMRMCGADFDCPTLLMSECVMTYMTRRCSSAMVKWAAETFQDAFFVMYEQINPDDAFGIFMQNHFHTIGSPLKCISAFPTVESQIRRFLDLGWQKCKCHDLNEIYRYSLTSGERARVETLDPFDEYEEFNLKCAHYFLLVASTASSVSDFIFTSPVADSTAEQPSPVAGMISQTVLPAGQSLVKRFSHSSTLVGGRYILTAGGFGEVDGRHQRVQEVSVTDTATMNTWLVRCHSDDIQYSRMYHSSVALSDGRVLLVGGRQSPFFLCSQLLLLELVMDPPSSAPTIQSSALLSSSMSDPSSQEPVQQTCDKSNGCAVWEQFSNARNSESICTKCGGLVCTTNRDGSGQPSLPTCAVNRCVCHTPMSCTDVCSSAGASDSSFARPDGESSARSNNTNVVTKGEQSLVTEGRDSVVTEKEERTEFDGGCLVTSVLKQSGDIPCPRWRHATVLVTVAGRDCVFLHGGRTQKAEVLSDSYLLDVYTGVWTEVKCSGDDPGARHSHTMVRWARAGGEQQVLMVGGVDEDQDPKASIHLLCLTSLTWTRLHIQGTLLPRYSHTCHMLEDRLVCVGGVNLHRQTPGVAIVNLSTGLAQEFSFPSVSRDQLLMYHRHDSVMLPDGTVVVLGGGGNCFSFGTHLNHTPVLLNISSCLETAP